MSSDKDESNDGDISSSLWQKMSRIQRACDICRRKKIRCDGVQMPGNPCSNCISSRLDCTYVEGTKKRNPPRGYVEDLQNKVEKLEKLERLVRRLCPNEAVYNQLNASLDSNWTIGESPVDPSALVDDIAKKVQPHATLETVTCTIRGAMEDTSRSDDDDPSLILADKLKRMAITSSSNDQVFGKSSGAMLLQTAFELKNEYAGDEGRFDGPGKPAVNAKRTEFWDTKPWERKSEATPSPKYNFPDLDLALHCIDLYFLHSNLYLPLLHRPTFDKSVKEGLHLTNDNFAPVLLLVCAVGARHSDNPRVRVDGIDSFQSAGWKWFEQVQILKQSPLAAPTLYDLQLYCLCIIYLQGSSSPESSWTLAGIAIRLAQDVGAHRRKPRGHTHTIDDELWKRAFWVLMCNDRLFSFSLGRPCAIQDEDFDLDLPVDCDDEYWDHPDPEKRFKQPPNKPSSVISFILYIKLQQVLAFTIRTIYSVNPSKILLGFVGPEWEQHIVAELDSALNKWVDSVPDHLRWDPNREDDTFFNQSVYLYATYYHIQIIIHRPFIPSPSKPSPLSFPSLAICTNAARSCSHVVDIHRKRKRKSLLLTTQGPVFTSGIVLLLSIWGGKRSGLFLDPDKEMVDVHKCMKALEASESRFPVAGRLWDLLYELACVGELPLPQPSPPSGTKRARESDSPLSTSAIELSSTLVSQNGTPRVIAGSRRVREGPLFISQTQQLQAYLSPHHQSQAAPPPSATTTSHMTLPPSDHSSSRNQSHTQIRQIPELSISTISTSTHADPPVFALPVYSDELGRLPLHGRMTSSAQAHLSQAQTHVPLLDPWTNYWHTTPPSASPHVHEHSEPTFPSLAGPSGASSYGLQYPPTQAPQQQLHSRSHHASQGISMGGLSEMSSTTQGPVSGNIFDSTFGAQAPLAKAQTYPPQIGLESWGRTASQSTSHPDASGMSSSYGPHYPPAPAPQQQPDPWHHASHRISGDEFPSVSEASSVAQGPYRMNAAELATGIFDATGGRAGYTQQPTSTYGLGPMHSSFPGMGSGLMASTPPQSSPGSSMEDVYKGMGMGTMPDRSSAHIQHQHQTVPPEQEQRASLYPYVIDNDAVAAWSNAPTGFELNKWSTFLSNFGELTQGNVQAHSGGQHQHEHQRVPQQHEQQPLSYPLIIDSDHDIRSNTPTGFKSENGVPSLPS